MAFVAVVVVVAAVVAYSSFADRTAAVEYTYSTGKRLASRISFDCLSPGCCKLEFELEMRSA